jgi:hypothetical protein
VSIGPHLTALALRLARPPVTRFAPSPTGYLHLGHVVNAILVWGVARALGGTVLLRIEDHDRIRSRPKYDAAPLEDLDWLGFTADAGRHPPGRQSERTCVYESARDTGVCELRAAGVGPADVVGRAAAAVGLPSAARPVRATEVAELFDRPEHG